MLIRPFVKTNIHGETYPAAVSGKICNMHYLNSITRGDEKSADNLADVFVTEINEELASLHIAIETINYTCISNISHKMKSAFAVLGISILEPVLKEMEQLSAMSSSIDTIKQLSRQISIVFKIAKSELKLRNPVI